MPYPKRRNLQRFVYLVEEYANLKHEFGSSGMDDILQEVETQLKNSIEKMRRLPECADLAMKEPNGLEDIRALRDKGPRRLWSRLKADEYKDRLEGAMLARFAGCTLGAPVEFWSIQEMEDWAGYIGFPFPPADYWPEIKAPNNLRYGVSPNEAYTSKKMDHVPVDDDITYTLLGLLIAEEFGLGFTVDDVGAAWLKYLPYACTAEEAALASLKRGAAPKEAADIDNPFCQWIGADIRSDPWAYMCPAYPEKAASLAYHDAYISHRRNGIYGEMFFAAAQSAAFASESAEEALKIGLTEIPSACSLHNDVLWALEEGKNIHDYRQARQAVDDHFSGMPQVHTNSNAALTIFGLLIGGSDVAKVLSQIVAMGMDNDCTAATAGSIIGAIVGKKGIPEHWYKPFNNKVKTYLIGHPVFDIDDVAARFMRLAEKAHEK
ncbi:MAG: ADP-ribosylglycohydrolase family protein [Clostridiales bacterium]|jgi:ADP-ribosylglycohydrolase|nr:ADP-ribosylglycohydrolase family protein [Clostridiales bacterium]